MLLAPAGSLTAVQFPCPGKLPLNLNRIERFPEASKGRNPNPSKPNIDKPYRLWVRDVAGHWGLGILG